MMFRDTCFPSCLTPMVNPAPERLQKFLRCVIGINQFLKFLLEHRFKRVRHREPESPNSTYENYRKLLLFVDTYKHRHIHIKTHTSKLREAWSFSCYMHHFPMFNIFRNAIIMLIQSTLYFSINLCHLALISLTVLEKSLFLTTQINQLHF